MAFLERLIGQSPHSKHVRSAQYLLSERLVRATTASDKERALEALAAGADPTAWMPVDHFFPLAQSDHARSFTNAIREAISFRHPQPHLLDAFLTQGFRPDAYEVQQVMRAALSHPDLARVLFKHGERFTASMQDRNQPALTQGAYLRQHVPELQSLDWESPAHGILRSPQAPATHPQAIDHLTFELRSAATHCHHDWLDEVRELVRRGARPECLLSVAIAANKPDLFIFELDLGQTMGAQDLQNLVQCLACENVEPDPHDLHGSYRVMVRALFDRGERFEGNVGDAHLPHLTQAQRIRAVSPILARDLDWSSPGAPHLPEPEPAAVPVRRRRLF